VTGRRESPEPSVRQNSRDPSPKTSNINRGSSPLTRGESPLRLLSRSGRNSSPGGIVAARPSTSSAPPSLSNLGLSIGALRSGSTRRSRPSSAGTSGGSTTGPRAPTPTGGRIDHRNPTPPRGMGAFRGSGPVRAKTDIRCDTSNTLRKARPSTAPSTKMTGASGSRPASPLEPNQRSSSTSSRPSSPHTRASSPAVAVKVAPVPGHPFSAQMDRPKHRSSFSHMRRAPSPTPAFNRNESPSKPKWRR